MMWTLRVSTPVQRMISSISIGLGPRASRTRPCSLWTISGSGRGISWSSLEESSVWVPPAGLPRMGARASTMSPATVTSVASCLRKLFVSAARGVERNSQHGEHLASLLAGEAGRDERAGSLGGRHDKHADADARDQPVAARKILRPRRMAGCSFADEKAALPDRVLEHRVLGRVDHIETAGDHRNGSVVEACGMGGPIEAARQSRTRWRSPRAPGRWRVVS